MNIIELSESEYSTILELRSIFSNNKIKELNKELLEKIDGKYPWYFINIMQLNDGFGIKSESIISLYGFDKEPQHNNKDGILGYSNIKIIHKLYENKLNGSINKDDLDKELRRYTKYNSGATYKEIKK